MRKWEEYLRDIDAGLYEIKAGGIDKGFLLIRADWRKKANGTKYDYFVWLYVYHDGSFSVMLGTQTYGTKEELQAMAAASYANRGDYR